MRRAESRARLGAAARLYYEHDLTHQEIGDILGLSRIKVSRMLARARQDGIVRITVVDDTPLFGVEAQAIAEKYGLEAVHIAPNGATDQETRIAVAKVAARAFAASIKPGSRVAIALSNTVLHTVTYLEKVDLGIEVLPATGTIAGRADGTSATELSLLLSERYGGRSYRLAAPLVARSAALAHELSRDPAIHSAFEAVASADLLIGGIGTIQADGGLLSSQLDAAELAGLRDSGAVGDYCAAYFDDAGRPVHTELTERIMGLGIERLRRIPRRLAMSFGASRFRATETAVRTGIPTILCTDHKTALRLLDSSAEPDADPAG